MRSLGLVLSGGSKISTTSREDPCLTVFPRMGFFVLYIGWAIRMTIFSTGTFYNNLKIGRPDLKRIMLGSSLRRWYFAKAAWVIGMWASHVAEAIDVFLWLICFADLDIRERSPDWSWCEREDRQHSDRHDMWYSRQSWPWIRSYEWSILRFLPKSDLVLVRTSKIGSGFVGNESSNDYPCSSVN
jgi:hypothetical protein